jgi:hypothetical protein
MKTHLQLYHHHNDQRFLATFPLAPSLDKEATGARQTAVAFYLGIPGGQLTRFHQFPFLSSLPRLERTTILQNKSMHQTDTICQEFLRWLNSIEHVLDES